jgi:hypothetical protein
VLYHPRSSRGSYEPPLPPGTRTASVTFGYGLRERSRDARLNRPMEGWRTKGVKSRLVVSVRSEETLNRPIETNLAEFTDLAGGAVGESGTRAIVRFARSSFTPRATRRTRSAAICATRPTVRSSPRRAASASASTKTAIGAPPGRSAK